MSNLSQFFGGGGPSRIIRGSTSFTAGSSTNTSVSVNASSAYLTQGCRGDHCVWRSGVFNAQSGIFPGSASARISGSQIVITAGSILNPTNVSVNFVSNTGIVDWECVEF